MKKDSYPAMLGLLALMGLAGCGVFSFESKPEITHATRLNVAMAAEASGDSQTALQLYATAVSKNPSDTNAVVLYARALVNARRIGLARELLSRQLSAQPNQAALSRELATIDVLQGQPAQALPRFDMALAKDPNDVRALVNKAIALDMLGNHTEAQALYHRADALEPDDATIRSNLAMSLMLAGRSSEAVQMMQYAAEGPAVAPRIRNNMAVLAASNGDMVRARQLSNGDISEAELRAFAEQVRNREPAAAGTATVAASAVLVPASVPTPIAVAAEPTRAPSEAKNIVDRTPSGEPSLAAAGQPVAVEPVATPPPAAAQPIDPVPPASVSAGAPILLEVPGAARRPARARAQPSQAVPPAAASRNNMTSFDRQGAAAVERAPVRDMAEFAGAPDRVATQATMDGDRKAPSRARKGARLGYSAQLGALDSERMAKWSWGQLSQRIPSLLDGRKGNIIPWVRDTDGRRFWSVRTSGFGDRRAANLFCEKVKGQGTDCIVTRS